MSKVLTIISTGFEEIEAISIIDILRRAEVEVTISTINELETIGANNITIKADIKLKELNNLGAYEMVVIPGGAQNTLNLASSELVQQTLKKMKDTDKYIGAICAAPYVLHHANILNKQYTCYPGFERKIDSAKHIENENVVKDEKVITSRGPATAMQFALELVKILKGEETYQNIKEGLLVTNF